LNFKSFFPVLDEIRMIIPWTLRLTVLIAVLNNIYSVGIECQLLSSNVPNPFSKVFGQVVQVNVEGSSYKDLNYTFSCGDKGKACQATPIYQDACWGMAKTPLSNAVILLPSLFDPFDCDLRSKGWIYFMILWTVALTLIDIGCTCAWYYVVFKDKVGIRWTSIVLLLIFVSFDVSTVVLSLIIGIGVIGSIPGLNFLWYFVRLLMTACIGTSIFLQVKDYKPKEPASLLQTEGEPLVT